MLKYCQSLVSTALVTWNKRFWTRLL